MVKEIAFNGITTTPDDYLSKDGDLSYCSDLIHEDGSIKPAPVPVELLQLGDGEELMYIHSQTGFRNWIIWSEGTPNGQLLSLDETYINSNPNAHKTALGITTKPKQVTSVGNDLVVLTNDGIRHLLYKNGSYKLLPINIPSIEQRFGLVGHYHLISCPDPIVLSRDGSQLPYPDLVASVYLNGRYWNYDIQNINYTGLTNLIQTTFAPGWYRITVNIAMIAGYAETILNGFDSNDNEVEHHAFDDPRRVKGGGYYVYYFQTSNVVTRWEIAVRAGDESELTNAMVEIHQGISSSDVPYSLTKDSSIDDFAIITAAAKRFIQEESLDKNRFIFPFFARTALKLVDGRYVNLSAPCLLIPNSGKVPFIQPLIDDYDITNFDPVTRLLSNALCCELQLQIGNISALEPWAEFVKEIVVAVTQPIYQIDLNVTDEDEQRNKFRIIEMEAGVNDGYSQSALSQSSISPLSPDANYPHGVYRNNNIFNSFVSGTRPNYVIDLPSVKNLRDEVEHSSTFYIIKSINIQELLDMESEHRNPYSTMCTLDLSGITLNNLQNYTALPDDYSSLNHYVPEHALSYNNRLHIADYSQQQFCGYNPVEMEGYVETTNYNYVRYLAKVVITDNHEQYTAMSVIRERTNTEPRYFFFPNITAKEATIYREYPPQHSGLRYAKCVLRLRQHPTLNGSYWFAGFESQLQWETIPWNGYGDEDQSRMSILFAHPEGTPALISKRNFMKLSEQDNPFTFTDKRTYPFDSRVMGMCPLTTALGTGQVGQFDLYVFTEQSGVWSLKVTDEGGYSNQVPVTRDALLSTKGFVQIDKAALFTTKRGLMLLQGSESVCVSESLNGIQKIELKNSVLPNISTLLDGSTAEITYNFRSYMANARIAYDYKNQRIVVFNPNLTYCYALSLRSQQWTILNMQLKYAINSYPDAYVVNGAEKVVNLSENNANGTLPDGIIVTRPFTLDDANEFKLIDYIRENGIMRFMTEDANQTPVQDITKLNQILYGSNDLQHWYLYASSKNGYMADKNGKHAGQYRFFRLAIKVKLDADETLDSFTISYRIKSENNKLM